MVRLDNLGHLPDLVRDSRLNATIEYVEGQVFTVHKRPVRHRTRPREERWTHEKYLGQGGFGVVSLQRKDITTTSQAEFRAVKSIQIPQSGIQPHVSLYVRELEALAKFSQDKVCAAPYL